MFELVEVSYDVKSEWLVRMIVWVIWWLYSVSEEEGRGKLACGVWSREEQ